MVEIEKLHNRFGASYKRRQTTSLANTSEPTQFDKKLVSGSIPVTLCLLICRVEMRVTHLRTTDHCIDRWAGLRLHCIQLFPDPRFLLFVLQNTVGYKKKKNGPRAVALMAGMAKMEVSPQDEMANP